MFPREKYKYFTDGKRYVIAEQTFAGKKYRGKAVCQDVDTFDLEVGKDLAAAKCDYKICNARYKEAKRSLDWDEQFYADIAEGLKRSTEYYDKASKELFEAVKRLNEVMIRNGAGRG